MLRFEDIRFDCKLYNGYKPCRYGNLCAACTYYEPIEGQEVRNPGRAVAIAQPVLTQPECEPTRILVIKTGAMGDVLRTTTLLPVLSRHYRDAHITWITDPAAVPLLKSNPFIRRLLPFTPESCAFLEDQVFDVLLNFEKEKEPLAFAGRIRAAHRIGFAPTRWNTPTIFNSESQYALLLGISDELKFRENCKSYPQIICEMTGLKYERDPYVLELTDQSRQRQEQVEALLADRSTPRIGLNTGCGAVFRTKQWTIEGWVGLIQHLQRETAASILLLGGKAETDLNAAILKQTSNVANTGTDNSLEEFFGVINACDLIVSSDSLGMHIGIALRKWVIALFGSTTHVEVDLYDRGEKIVTDFACSPCYLKNCDKQPTCMQALTPEVVCAAALRGLQSLSENQARP
jgi:heptosyltransferase-2